MLHDRPGHCSLHSAHHPVLPSWLTQENRLKWIRTPYPLCPQRPPRAIPPSLSCPQGQASSIFALSLYAIQFNFFSDYTSTTSAPQTLLLCPLELIVVIGKGPLSSASSLRVAIAVLLWSMPLPQRQHYPKAFSNGDGFFLSPLLTSHTPDQNLRFFGALVTECTTCYPFLFWPSVRLVANPAHSQNILIHGPLS